MRKTLSVSVISILSVFSILADGTKPLIWGKCELPSPFHVPHYTGKLFPTPQNAVYHDDFIPMKAVAVLTGGDVADDDPRIDALRARITYLGGRIQVAKTLESAPPGATIIAMGDTAPGSGFSPPQKEQGYIIMPTEQSGRNIIILKGFDHQGLLWAVTSLNQLITVKDGSPVARRAEVHDFPRHRLRGFKAGGWHRRAWHPAQTPGKDAPAQETEPAAIQAHFENGEKDDESMEQIEDEDEAMETRIAIQDLEARAWYIVHGKMNYVIIGGFHSANRPNRGNWRNPPPPLFLDGIRRTGELLSPLGIQWFSGYNPCPRAQIAENRWGAGIDTAVEEDFQIIMRDARTMAEAGGGFFLAFDDYRFGLLREESRRFGTAREADLYFVTRLHNELRAEYPDASIVFCPPFYWGPRGGVSPRYGENQTEYLRRIGDLPEEVDIIWTGPRVGASKIPENRKSDVEWIVDRIRRKPVFWQNLSHNEAIPRTPRYAFPLDAIVWWKTAFYDGLYDDVKVYVPNCPMSMPDLVVGALTLSDYLWNPDAYDAERSVREAATMMFGVEALPKLEAFHDAMNYFNRYNVGGYDLSRERLEGAAANIIEIRRMVRLLGERWETVLESVPEIGRWSAMPGFAGRPRGFPGRLENNTDLRPIIREIESTAELAVQDTGMDPEKDIFLPAYIFRGGIDSRTPVIPTDPMAQSQDEIFSILSEPRTATWMKDEKSALRARFFLLDPPGKGNSLVLVGQERDPGPTAEIKIFINDTLIYEGESGLPRHDWATAEFKIPDTVLKTKDNHLRIENSGIAVDVPRFLINYAMIKMNRK